MKAREFTQKEVSEIIKKLKMMFPDYEIKMSLDCPSVVKPEYIRFCKKTGESKLDGKVMVGIYDIQLIHIFECHHMVTHVEKEKTFLERIWKKILSIWI